MAVWLATVLPAVVSKAPDGGLRIDCKPAQIFSILLQSSFICLLACMGLCNLFSYLDYINSIRVLFSFHLNKQ